MEKPFYNDKPDLVERKLEELIPWEDNPRTVDKESFNRLIEQIKLLGVYKPLLINQNNIVLGGNMRTMAFKELGITDVLCSVVKTDNKWQMMEYALSDNDQIGVTDEQKLAEYITLNPGARTELFAINSRPMKLVSSMLEEFGPEIEEDEAPEVSEEVFSKLGEVYLLGRHRVMCGDSTDKTSVELLMNGDKADMVFTDPPYGVDYDGGHAVKGKRREKLENDGDADIYNNVLPNLYNFTQDKAAFYIWYSDSKSLAVLSAVLSAGLELRCNIIWNKNVAQFGAIGAQYKTKHEPVMYLFKKGKAPNWYGPNNEVSVWDVSRDHKNGHHPTQKPLELPARAMKNSSKSGDIVLDLFLGSGSTLIACEQTDRICYGMELDPHYIDVIRKRYAKLIDPDNWETQWQTMTPKL